MDIPVELSKTIINETSQQQIIVLSEKGGTRSVPIVIGIVEIMAIDRKLKNIAPPRPMTHELLNRIIEKIGGKIKKIVIGDLKDHTYYATIYIAINDKIVEIDARPSDAIAISAGTEIPLYVSEQVFEKM
ncbi:MAG: bifunctional nuclease family protein [Anaerohalosphaeraceae bacterium]|nr:bifunctional nuclease family protein [Anaerohalosphaeraceae bacterium]